MEDVHTENHNLINKNYHTIDVKDYQGNLVLVSNIKLLNEFKNTLKLKKLCAVSVFVFILIVDCIIQSYVSYLNYKDCQTKIATAENIYENPEHNYSKIISVCVSYLIHMFLTFGFFIVAFLALWKQTKLSYQVFEVFILVMFICDMILSVITP